MHHHRDFDELVWRRGVSDHGDAIDGSAGRIDGDFSMVGGLEGLQAGASGGKSYICPVRGVAISRLPTILRLPGWRSPAEVPLTWLNDITFTRYHLFRAQVKILP